jgi:outer membrane receptor protein involved in Fe transport
MVTQFDVHVGYEHLLTKRVRLSLYADVINLFNQREVLNVDDEYTFTSVNPIVYGKPEDLKRLKSADGSPLVVNSNYGQPTAFQEPLFMRLGARLSF